MTEAFTPWLTQTLNYSRLCVSLPDSPSRHAILSRLRCSGDPTKQMSNSRCRRCVTRCVFPGFLVSTVRSASRGNPDDLRGNGCQMMSPFQMGWCPLSCVYPSQNQINQATPGPHIKISPLPDVFSVQCNVASFLSDSTTTVAVAGVRS